MTHAEESESAVLAANARFYRAFSEGDLASMNALWAEHAPVACLHPGQPLLLGRDAVLRAWRDILEHQPGIELSGQEPSVQLFGDTAIVYCYEAASDQPAHLAATNVFVLEGRTWRMVHHHAGPLAEPRAPRRANDLN
jgi:ketosteroid isomerase-like protein